MMNYQKPLTIHLDLTASFFETGVMATPSKSQNPIILDVGVPASSQWFVGAQFGIHKLHELDRRVVPNMSFWTVPWKKGSRPANSSNSPFTFIILMSSPFFAVHK